MAEATPAWTAAARTAAGDEPRVHRRRAAVPGRQEQLDRGEGAQGPGGPRRGGDRGGPAGRPLADGAPVELRPALHREHADRGQRARGRACADEDRGRSRRPHRARHAEQLRQRHDALGHLPQRRGELGLLLRRPGRARCRPAPLGPAPERPVALGRTRSALRRGRGIRTNSTASAGSSRSTPTIRRQCRSSAPRSAAARRRAPGSRPPATAARWCTPARTRASSTSTSSSAATGSPRAAPRPTPRCSTTAPCTSRASMPTAPAAGCRWCRARGR
jgi:hypothetical protein